MASSLDKDKVRRMIDEYYKAAEYSGWNGEVNERVAAVFGRMIAETAQCSRGMSWVPRPPGGKASIVWLCTQLGSGFIRSLREKSSVTCMKFVIRNFGSELRTAGIFDN